VNLAIALVTGLVFGCSFGWCWGYHARPQPRRVWACARCDNEAIRAEVVRFNAVVAGLDFDTTDDPGTTT
jgi:hypothetical protein